MQRILSMKTMNALNTLKISTFTAAILLALLLVPGPAGADYGG